MRYARFATLAALLAAAGCANYSSVGANAPVQVGDNVSVLPQIQWGQAPFPGFAGTLWTEDGAALDSLMFFTGIKPGEPLINANGVSKDELRTYQAGMLPNDVMDLLATNFSKLSFQQIRTSNLRPAPFGSATGFRFDLTFSTKDGLNMRGTALAAQRGGKLDMILFIAPDEYYFGHYADTVEKIFASVQVPPPSGSG
ncbi:MAG TPA: hypothetical protein VMH86_12625 [Rhizomicrobium sp.]|nr:hypothetical protein [Rhizomicrobium sp.]